MYLWQLLNSEESELTKRIYETQKISNNVGDWVRPVEGDKIELGITLTDSKIQGVSQNVFKNLVLKKVKINHDKYLDSLKKKKNQRLNI